MTVERSEPDALPPRRDPLRRSERRTRPFHQRAELHTTRTRRFAPPTLDTRLHEVDEGLIDSEIAGLDGTHCVDASTRRVGLLARHPKRRAVGKTQSARHAGRQLVRIKIEHTVEHHASVRRSVRPYAARGARRTHDSQDCQGPRPAVRRQRGACFQPTGWVQRCRRAGRWRDPSTRLGPTASTCSSEMWSTLTA